MKKTAITSIIFVCLFSLIGCVQNTQTLSEKFAGPANNSDMTFPSGDRKKIIDLLVDRSMSSGLTVTESSDHLVIAEGVADSFGAMFLYGSKYDGTPAIRIRYNIAQVGNDKIRVNGQAVMVTNPGSAFERINDVTPQMSGYISNQLRSIESSLTATSRNSDLPSKSTSDRYADNKSNLSGSDISSWPNNAGGVSITLPKGLSIDGEIVPVFASFASPVLPGDRIVVAADGLTAMEIRSSGPPITGMSSRLRLRNGQVSIYVHRKSGAISSATSTTAISRPAAPVPARGKSITDCKVVSKTREVKILCANGMAKNGGLRKLTITPQSGLPISVDLTSQLSSQPFLSLESSANLSGSKVTASL